MLDFLSTATIRDNTTRICSDVETVVYIRSIHHDFFGHDYLMVRWSFFTPKNALSLVNQPVCNPLNSQQHPGLSRLWFEIVHNPMSSLENEKCSDGLRSPTQEQSQSSSRSSLFQPGVVPCSCPSTRHGILVLQRRGVHVWTYDQ